MKIKRKMPKTMRCSNIFMAKVYRLSKCSLVCTIQFVRGKTSVGAHAVRCNVRRVI